MAKLIFKNIELGNYCLIKAEKMRQERAEKKLFSRFIFQVISLCVSLFFHTLILHSLSLQFFLKLSATEMESFKLRCV